jgi:hypothetical protein
MRTRNCLLLPVLVCLRQGNVSTSSCTKPVDRLSPITYRRIILFFTLGL